jgi:hypothetical protein
MARGQSCGFGVQGSGEAAQGPAPARCATLLFEPDHGGQADPGAASKLLLGQAVLPA